MRLTPPLAALVLVVAGLGVAVSGAAHTQQSTAHDGYEVHDQGVLTGYGGPVAPACGYDGTGGLLGGVETFYEVVTGEDSPADLPEDPQACDTVRGLTGPMPGLHEHLEDPATGGNAFVPCGEQSVRTNGSGGQHQHVGSCVSYSLHARSDASIEAHVHFENTKTNPSIIGPSGYSADLDLYLYGPNGSIVDRDEGPSLGLLGVHGEDLTEDPYTVLLVARYGAAPYDTTIRVTE